MLPSFIINGFRVKYDDSHHTRSTHKRQQSFLFPRRNNAMMHEHICWSITKYLLWTSVMCIIFSHTHEVGWSTRVHFWMTHSRASDSYRCRTTTQDIVRLLDRPLSSWIFMKQNVHIDSPWTIFFIVDVEQCIVCDSAKDARCAQGPSLLPPENCKTTQIKGCYTRIVGERSSEKTVDSADCIDRVFSIWFQEHPHYADALTKWTQK